MKYFFQVLISSLCLCPLCKGGPYGSALEGGKYFFDLDNDPTETTNLYYDTDYSTYINDMEIKVPMLSDDVKDAEIPCDDDRKTVWKKKGGVTSWLNDTFKRDVEHIYSFADAPHIVYFLVDDWGYNDVGYRSTYMNWTTPTIDRLAAEGMKLENYYTSDLCTPSRGALLTGRYPYRLGLGNEEDEAELPLDEVTLAEELKSAGYRTYMVGKWHLGMSSPARTPLYRGFDEFYGFLGGFVDYWTKEYGGTLDLQDGESLETDPAALSSDLHNAYLLESKAEAMVKSHAVNYPDTPMFLYMSSQLIHADWAAPDVFLRRCNESGATADQVTYCAMNVMLDEAVANLTCVLEEYGFANNTVLIIASDNGGVSAMAGNSYPFRGNKGSFFRGGLSGLAIIHSPLIPLRAKGKQYNGQVHITDWLPTLMGLATNGEWTGSYSGATIDGVDIWEALLYNLPAPHAEMVHFVDKFGNCSMQQSMLKLDIRNDQMNSFREPEHVFEGDQDPELSHMQCPSVSLMYPDEGLMVDVSSIVWPSALPTASPTSKPTHKPTLLELDVIPTASPSTTSPSTTSPSTTSPSTTSPSTTPPSTTSPSTTSPSTTSPSTISLSTTSPSTTSPITTSPSTTSPTATSLTVESTTFPTQISFSPSTDVSIAKPTSKPSRHPSSAPTEIPSESPTPEPSREPIEEPSYEPSIFPTATGFDANATVDSTLMDVDLDMPFSVQSTVFIMEVLVVFAVCAAAALGLLLKLLLGMPLESDPSFMLPLFHPSQPSSSSSLLSSLGDEPGRVGGTGTLSHSGKRVLTDERVVVVSSYGSLLLADAQLTPTSNKVRNFKETPSAVTSAPVVPSLQLEAETDTTAIGEIGGGKKSSSKSKGKGKGKSKRASSSEASTSRSSVDGRSGQGAEVVGGESATGECDEETTLTPKATSLDAAVVDGEGASVPRLALDEHVVVYDEAQLKLEGGKVGGIESANLRKGGDGAHSITATATSTTNAQIEGDLPREAQVGDGIRGSHSGLASLKEGNEGFPQQVIRDSNLESAFAIRIPIPRPMPIVGPATRKTLVGREDDEDYTQARSRSIFVRSSDESVGAGAGAETPEAKVPV